MSSDVIDERVLKKMIKQGFLKEENLPLLLSEKRASQEPMLELILKHQFMSEVQLISFLAEEYKCASINPNHFAPDESVVRLVPSAFAHKHRVLPISKYNNSLTVAMENPADLILIDDIKAITNMKIRPAVTFPKAMTAALERYYPSGEMVEKTGSEQTIEELIRIEQERKDQDSESETITLLRQAQETPVIKIANLLLLEAIRKKASDLFVEPWENSIRARCRVDGLLEEIPSPPKSMGSALVSRFKVMSQLNIAERRMPQDGRLKLKFRTVKLMYASQFCRPLSAKKFALESWIKKHNLITWNSSDLAWRKWNRLKSVRLNRTE